jgi:uncharacterized protein YndB with AHSA1/START domain
MTAIETTPSSTADREIVTTRLFDAPRELVWRAWTEPAHVGQWWGPSGFTNTIIEMDVRPGGVWRFIMHGPEGVDYPNRIVFTEVTPPERLVYIHSDDADDDPFWFESSATFAEEDGKTRVTLVAVFASREERDQVVKEVGAVEGAQQTFNRLGEYLARMA